MFDSISTRRRFLALLPAAVLPLFGMGRPAVRNSTRPLRRVTHPTPRPGIDASRVVPRERLSDAVAPLFDGVREIPHVVDGIECYCGCANVPDHYSLLSCYEGDGMAQVCAICKGEGRLVVRLHKQGKSLDEIRAAIDAEFA